MKGAAKADTSRGCLRRGMRPEQGRIGGSSWWGGSSDKGRPMVNFVVDSDTGAAVAMKVLDKATIVNHHMMLQDEDDDE